MPTSLLFSETPKTNGLRNDVDAKKSKHSGDWKYDDVDDFSTRSVHWFLSIFENVSYTVMLTWLI